MPVVVRMPWRVEDDPDYLLTREWLVTNGLGGYASGSLSGAVTRRHHGLLVAALPAPLGRVVMLNHLDEEVRVPGGAVVRLGGEELASGELGLHMADVLQEFRLQAGLPVWRYAFEGVVLERQVVLVNLQNTVHVTYRLLEAPGTVRVRLRPSMHFRSHNGRVDVARFEAYQVTAHEDRIEVTGRPDLPSLKLRLLGARTALVLDGGRYREFFYRVEAARGYDAQGHLYSPGYLRADLEPGREITLVASTEDWEAVATLTPADALEAEMQRRTRLVEVAPIDPDDPCAAELVLAADQFVVVPNTRPSDVARARAAGRDIRTIVAGYHWFTDWGRDTMISLEGLCLATGRSREAEWILHAFAHHVRDGLIPNLFPEGEREGLYHTVDATLWFFHAIARYERATGDRDLVEELLPTLHDIVAHHVRGTRFGIRVDDDDLITQGSPDHPLTWMDAKVDDWIVTPRRGKPVEVNALWYNALMLLAGWCERLGDGRAAALRDRAARTRNAFGRRFWYAGGWCYDVVDGENGDDPALRPNQLLAFALDHPILDERRWATVLDVVTRELLTPVGLRSLSRDHPDYKPYYDGDLRARDAAYHQGTVWSWLIGPYVDAWLRVHPGDHAGARAALVGLVAHMREAGMGSVAEIFDAEAPFTPRGCIAQAWGVAELLRCWLRTAG